MTKRNLQIITAILAIVPILTGLIGMLGIHDPVYGEIETQNIVLLDSNLRFLNGVWLMLGIAVLSILKNIEKNTRIFRLVWAAIFLGGLGRLISIIYTGIPPGPFIGFTILEILGAPFFMYWQSKLATPEKRTNPMVQTD